MSRFWRFLVFLALATLVRGSVSAQPVIISRGPLGIPADFASTRPRASADGLRVVFVSKATNLVPGDTNNRDDIFLWDARVSPAVVTRISVSTSGAQANGHSANPSISPDGEYVAWDSVATNLGAPPTNGWANVYVRNLSLGTTTWVSRAYNGAVPALHCGRPSMSDVGLVAFECLAPNMVASDTNNCTDVFVANILGGSIKRVSTTTSDQQATDGYSQKPTISSDGTRVAFETYASDLAPYDTNRAMDVCIKFLQSGLLLRVMNSSGNEPNGPSARPFISGDGTKVVFESAASNLDPNDTNRVYDVFQYDVTTHLTYRVSLATDLYESPSGGIEATTDYYGVHTTFYGAGGHTYLATGQTVAPYTFTDPPGQHVRSVMLVPRTGYGDAANAESRDPAVAPMKEVDRAVVLWTTNASNLMTDDQNGEWDIYAREIRRFPSVVAPATVPAAPASAPVTLQGLKVGLIRDACRTFCIPVSAPTPALDVANTGTAAAAPAPPSPPQVTVGTVPATAVQIVDDNTLRFVVPPLPAGSSNRVLVRYDDGETLVAPLDVRSMTVAQGTTTDSDADTIPDWWELTFGLDPLRRADASADDDGDGLTNLQEYQQARHPHCVQTRYLAEGASGDLFETEVALANPTMMPAVALLRFLDSKSQVRAVPITVDARSRKTVLPSRVSGLASAEFSTVVEADGPILVDRTMWWPKTSSTPGYGAHSERGVVAPAPVWYLAEGATHSTFDLFYLIQNPNTTAADVEVRYLLPAPLAPIVKTYTVKAQSRFNIWVDLADPALAATDVSAVITSLHGQPIIVERAMYASTPQSLYNAGHESAGVTQPATTWFLAEGNTGPYFDLFVLVANPGPRTADVEARYLLTNGRVYTKRYSIPPDSRFNIWVDLEEIPAGSGVYPLADVAVSTTIRSVNGQPVIVERAMWWPGPPSNWIEAHNSPGATTTGTIWGMAAGEAGGTQGAETFILMANTSNYAGSAIVTLLFEDGTTATRTYALPANSRSNAWVNNDFPAAANRRFGAVVESVTAAGQASPAQIVVERATYTTVANVRWAAGTNALATKIQ